MFLREWTWRKTKEEGGTIYAVKRKKALNDNGISQFLDQIIAFMTPNFFSRFTAQQLMNNGGGWR